MARMGIHRFGRALSGVTLLLLVWFGVARAVAAPTAVPPPPGARTPAATATPKLTCQDLWSVVTIHTVGDSESRTKNARVSHRISGHIENPAALRKNAHRILVCPGTTVTATIMDQTGRGGSITALSANMVCRYDTCEVEDISGPESYEAVSADGKDTDRIDFVVSK